MIFEKQKRKNSQKYLIKSKYSDLFDAQTRFIIYNYHVGVDGFFSIHAKAEHGNRSENERIY